ncbi:response regulator transcription factor [Oceanihabitans sediminis]|uniref:DNA-binding response regulator n=1 Tax=Oceanihabitans sediminis TaxID=1812012 RepID=A0A368P9P8_9FLAO|nr:response regulator transcription factor [Oceanihabitans sediminis]MDX1278350.1 response regulator transcription factor [Oceanihabitans sediminis]RBP34273.1 LuxR family two component transcriptional regulator [Oceanihabitans sediminis]RCU57961.1 DNA-binding response regulator [Oceanihabitans sediminis]
MIKLLVVDHHPIIRKGLELLFIASPNIKVVGALDNGEAIFDFLNKNKVDIIIAEIDLPKLNGLTALRRLKKEHAEVKVIMFSAQPEEIYAINAIKAGASGYLSKTANIVTINEAILKVHNGGIYLSNDLAQRLAVGRRVSRTGNFYKKLSTREIEVLKLISSGRKNKEIAIELDINEKTVSTYKARLMKKLNVSNIVDLINRAKLLEL